MADDNFQRDYERDAARRLQILEAIANAYGFVHGWEQKRTLAAINIGDLIQARINEIRGPHPQGLPSRLEEVDTVKANFDSAIAQLRADEELTGG